VHEDDRSFPDELRAAAVREVFEETGITLDSDGLVLFARWVTPSMLRRRFDARFYLSRMPEGQTVRPQEGEIVDWTWVSPARALEDARLNLVYATRAVLESVADAPDVETLFARARALEDVPIVEPRIVKTDKGWEVVRD
jgi:8-oxo-dGTP pyrophosphatase MutT (NUDIX family)